MPGQPPRTELPWGTRLQYLKTVYLGGCGTYVDAFVEFGLPALGTAALVLFTPSPGELVENYLEPKAFRGRGRFPGAIVRRGRSGPDGRLRRVFAGGLPDVDELIADRLPGRAFFGTRIPGLVERWIWTGINVVDLIGFGILLVEVTDEFTLGWVSNMIEAKFCDAAFKAVGQWGCNSRQVVGNFNPWDSPLIECTVTDPSGWGRLGNGWGLVSGVPSEGVATWTVRLSPRDLCPSKCLNCTVRISAMSLDLLLGGVIVGTGNGSSSPVAPGASTVLTINASAAAFDTVRMSGSVVTEGQCRDVDGLPCDGCVQSWISSSGLMVVY